MRTSLNHSNVLLLVDFIRLNGRLVKPSEDAEMYRWIQKLKRDVDSKNLSIEDMQTIKRALPCFIEYKSITDISEALKRDRVSAVDKMWVYLRKNYLKEYEKSDFFILKMLEKMTSPSIIKEILMNEVNTTNSRDGRYNIKYLRIGILHSFTYVPYKTAYVVAERFGLFDEKPKDYKWLSEKLNISCLDCFSIEKNALIWMGGSKNPVNYLYKEGYNRANKELKISFDYRAKSITNEEFVDMLKKYTFYDSIQKNGR